MGACLCARYSVHIAFQTPHRQSGNAGREMAKLTSIDDLLRCCRKRRCRASDNLPDLTVVGPDLVAQTPPLLVTWFILCILATFLTGRLRHLLRSYKLLY